MYRRSLMVLGVLVGGRAVACRKAWGCVLLVVVGERGLGRVVEGLLLTIFLGRGAGRMGSCMVRLLVSMLDAVVVNSIPPNVRGSFLPKSLARGVRSAAYAPPPGADSGDHPRLPDSASSAPSPNLPIRQPSASRAPPLPRPRLA